MLILYTATLLNLFISSNSFFLVESLGFSIHMIKTTMRYHLTPVRMATIKKLKTTSVGKDVKKLEPLYTFGWNAK